MAKKDKDPIGELVKTARAVWNAFLKFGPVDDGTPQGDRFDKALDRLMAAEIAAKHHLKHNPVPTLEILLKLVRSPGGRGRNSHHWEGTTTEAGWMNSVRGASEELVIGKLILRHQAFDNPPPRVVITRVD